MAIAITFFILMAWLGSIMFAIWVVMKAIETESLLIGILALAIFVLPFAIAIPMSTDLDNPCTQGSK